MKIEERPVKTLLDHIGDCSLEFFILDRISSAWHVRRVNGFAGAGKPANVNIVQWSRGSCFQELEGMTVEYLDFVGRVDLIVCARKRAVAHGPYPFSGP